MNSITIPERVAIVLGAKPTSADFISDAIIQEIFKDKVTPVIAKKEGTMKTVKVKADIIKELVNPRVMRVYFLKAGGSFNFETQNGKQTKEVDGHEATKQLRHIKARFQSKMGMMEGAEIIRMLDRFDRDRHRLQILVDAERFSTIK